VHELSIVYGLVSSVTEAAHKAGARKVKTVTLRLGALAGVVEDALQFSYDVAIKDTLLDGSTLVVQHLPIVIHCDTCPQDQELPGPMSFRCPVCGTASGDIRQGRELEGESIEIEVDDEDADRRAAIGTAQEERSSGR
jgi:hydrogenase nickel incorporation protein HypA/HybF